MKKVLSLILIVLFGIIVVESFVINYKYERQDNKVISASEVSKIYETSSYLTDEIMNKAQRLILYAEFEHEYTPDYMLQASDAVVLASIVSVDGADTKYSKSVGNTYGKMIINNSIYGNLEEGTIIDYMKSGGIMSLDEYDKYQPDGMRENDYELRKEAGIDGSKEYMSFHFQNDPEIESGKIYLCYLKYIESIGKYEIIGLGNGFRELNIPKSNIVSTQTLKTDLYQILNNNTGEYESLNEYINKNIKSIK